MATSALAAVFNGGNSNNTIIGTPSADKITEGNGNDVVYGLGGADVIIAGNGDDTIDGDGHCMPGSASASYCSHGPIPGDGGDQITAGDGNDAIYGGGGNNKITAGRGNDVVYGGPLNDTITVGIGAQGNDLVYLGAGTNTVSVGNGSNIVFAARPGQSDARVDTITCGTRNSIVIADRQDVTHNCSVVCSCTSATAATRRLLRCLAAPVARNRRVSWRARCHPRRPARTHTGRKLARSRVSVLRVRPSN